MNQPARVGTRTWAQLMVAAAVLMLVPTSTHALSIEPGFVDQPLERGESTQVNLLVTNTSDNQLRLTIDTTTLTFRPDGTMVVLPTDQPSLADSILTLAPSNLVVPAQERREVVLTVSVPRDYSEPTFYGAVVFSTAPSSDDQADPQSSVAVTHDLVIPLFFELATVQAQPDMKIDSFTLKLKQSGTTHELTSYLTLENTGNVHLKPFGSVTFTNLLTGRVVSKDQINASLLLMVPATKRQFVSSVSTSGLARFMPIEVRLNLHESHFPGILEARQIWIPTEFWLLVVALLLSLVGLYRFLIRKIIKTKYAKTSR